jgi:hypothetical protein
MGAVTQRCSIARAQGAVREGLHPEESQQPCAGPRAEMGQAAMEDRCRGRWEAGRAGFGGQGGNRVNLTEY